MLIASAGAPRPGVRYIPAASVPTLHRPFGSHHVRECLLLATRIVPLALCLLSAGIAQAGTASAAVAASMKSAFGELVSDFQSRHPGDTIRVTYGSSGKLVAQIANGAPFDLFFSADTTYPRQLVEKSLTVGPPNPYATGHLVLWSLDPQLGRLALNELPKSLAGKFAIANPRVAPYGLRAQEALQRAGVWDALQPRLVLGENINQAAQFIDTGAADAGLIALSLVLGPELRGKGAWSPVPGDWHRPLTHDFVILKPAAGNAVAKAFAGYVATPPALAILKRYGFDAP